MSTGHKHRHTGRRPRRCYRFLFAQNGTASSKDQGTSTGHMGRGTIGGGMMSRGMMVGCSEMVHSMNASGRSAQSWATFSPDAEALLAARLERVSLDDIARQAQPSPLHPHHRAHHHG